MVKHTLYAVFCALNFLVSQSFAQNVNSSMQNKSEINIGFGGDFMIANNYQAINNKKFFDPTLMSELQKNDFNVLNLEGAVGYGHGYSKCGNRSNCFQFKMNPEELSLFKDWRVEMVNLANNHLNDYGYQGMLKTILYLNKYNIDYFGTEEKPFTVKQINNQRIGVIGFAPHTLANRPDKIKTKEDLLNLCRQSDIIVAFTHFGKEGNSAYKVENETEYYYGQNRGNIVDFSNFLMKNGVDVVINSGPHVLRKYEKLSVQKTNCRGSFVQSSFVAYSLGNLFTYGAFSLERNLKYGGVLNISINPQDKINNINYKFIGTEQRKNTDELGFLINQSLMAENLMKNLISQ